MDMETLTKNYTGAILAQCDNVIQQLDDMDSNFVRLITIQATYDAFKYYVGQLNDIETQQQIYKVIEFDARNLVYPVPPNVTDVGHG